MLLAVFEVNNHHNEINIDQGKTLINLIKLINILNN